MLSLKDFNINNILNASDILITDYMKSILVRELKEMGFRKIQGKAVELYSFYELCGFRKAIREGKEVK